MLSPQDNEILTRVGPGTPCGELLRRYWHPVGYGGDLTEKQPTRFVRLLGEDLVLFKDKSGRVGLLADHCSHRGASLLYGRVEEQGIACAYHGWLYDIHGNCLETPAEPANSLLHLTVKHRSYPVQEFIGMYWAYLGPEPSPVIPRYDVWARRDGRRWVVERPLLDCNWLQPMENSVDPAHSHFLHKDSLGLPPVVGFDFREVSFGIMKGRVSPDKGKGEEHPLIFPNILRQGDSTEIRIPVDDTHTRVIQVHFTHSPDGSLVEDDGDLPVQYDEPWKEPADGLHPFVRFKMDDGLVSTLVGTQDFMAWETQGPITDRQVERLGTTDRGIVLFREMLRREIERVQQGLDPMGMIRDPDHEIIDTNLDEILRQRVGVGRDRRGRQASEL